MLPAADFGCVSLFDIRNDRPEMDSYQTDYVEAQNMDAMDMVNTDT